MHKSLSSVTYIEKVIIINSLLNPSIKIA